MEFKNLIKRKEAFFIVLLLAIVTLITVLLLNIDIKIGTYYVRDVYSYLNTALFFSGYESGVPNLRGLSPVIPILTSLFFRLGFISDKTIMIVSSLFYIVSSLGVYALLRLRFNELMSFTGALIFATFPINLVWVSKGMLDIPGIALSIWAIYLMILSIKKDSKIFYLAYPIVIIAFFTRYTAILTLPIMLIMLLLVKNPLKYIKKHLKHLFGGIISGFITLIAFLEIYKIYELPLFFLSQSQSISSQAKTSINAAIPIYNNLNYYIHNLPIYLGTKNYIPYSLEPRFLSKATMSWSGGSPSIIGYILISILIFGTILYILKFFNKENRKKLLSQTLKKKIILLLPFIGLLILFFITFTKISIIISLIILSLSLLSLYRFLLCLDMKYLFLDFIFIYWFLINFVFFTYHHIKVDRYAITFTPFLAYWIILSIYLIFEKIKSLKIMKNKEKILAKLKIIVPIALICIIFIFSAAYSLANEPHTFDNQKPYNLLNASNEEKSVGNWLINYDANYKNNVIWADRGGDMSFILKMHIYSVDHLSNKSNFTSELLKNNVTYYISKNNRTVNYPYSKLVQYGEVSLYSIKK